MLIRKMYVATELGTRLRRDSLNAILHIGYRPVCAYCHALDEFPVGAEPKTEHTLHTLSG